MPIFTSSTLTPAQALLNQAFEKSYRGRFTAPYAPGGEEAVKMLRDAGWWAVIERWESRVIDAGARRTEIGPGARIFVMANAKTPIPVSLYADIE